MNGCLIDVLIERWVIGGRCQLEMDQATEVGQVVLTVTADYQSDEGSVVSWVYFLID